MSSVLIETQDLTRAFDGRLAVDRLNLSLGRGRVLALLGPNGAGKTTTMRMLAGLLAPSSGSARVCGFALGQRDQDNDAIRARCGVVPEAPGFYERLSAAQNLSFFAGLQGLDDAQLQSRVGEELQRFDLATRANDRVGTYSKGMKQRLSLARALLHEPALLFLDEPTAGLDPRATAELHQLIRELRESGKGIVLSTHTMEEAEALADDILVLDTQTRFYGQPQDLQAQAEQLVLIKLAEVFTVELTLPSAAHWMGRTDTELRILLATQADTPVLVASLVKAGAQILSVEPERRGLRQRYLELLKQ